MTTLRLASELAPALAVSLAMAASLGAWFYYRRERHAMPKRLRVWLPALRAATFFLVLLTLARPVLHHRKTIGTLGRVAVLVDASRSMSVVDRNMPLERKRLIAHQHGWLPNVPSDGAAPTPGDAKTASALKLFDAMSRWQRAEQSLLDPLNGVLAALARSHEVELLALSESEVTRLWRSDSGRSPPEHLEVDPVGRNTDLGTAASVALQQHLGGDRNTAGGSPPGTKAALVLLTDGRHNQPASPLPAAQLLGSRGVALYAVGLGDLREPPDLALVEARHPTTVLQKDRVRGTLVIRDQMPAGDTFAVHIACGNRTLWKQEITTQNTSPRYVDFECSVDELVEELRGREPTDVSHHAVPLSLRATISPLAGETETTNNEWAFHVMVITQEHSLLLLDGRPRWETRYLRNAFQRDRQWKIDTVVAGSATETAKLPRGDQRDAFPADENKSMSYDLIVFGEVPPSLLEKHEQLWIRRFVEERGGGILFIDGLRGCLRQLDGEGIGALLPVSWLPTQHDTPPAGIRLTLTGANLDALALEPESGANAKLWSELPSPHRIVPVKPLPGTEVLVETDIAGQAFPLIVTRSFGAGRVLYFASDETWRWRYKVADQYHQRFWNQVAQWIMDKPFAVSDDYVALDAGAASYRSGETAEIRVRLRDAEGRPVMGVMAEALLWQDGRALASVPLSADSARPGTYRGRTEPLAEGRYEVSVRAPGFGEAAARVRTEFVVLPPADRELQQLACHESLLNEMATAAGGRFLREEQIGQLPDLLQPLSSGQVIESDTVLWQSFWWFVPIIVLLTAEWFLRKRAGLL